MVDVSPYGDPLLVHVANRLVDVFNIGKPAVTKCGVSYTCMVEGSLLVWNEVTDGFNLMYPLPTSDGLVDLLTCPEVIRNKRDLRFARLAADQIFRDHATFARRPVQYGHFAEDLFLRICVRLGFRLVRESSAGDAYTVRQGSPREDMVEKIDFILVFEPDQIVPLQFTTEHQTVIHPEKQARINNRDVAYLACDKFTKSIARSNQLIRVAAGLTAADYELWLFGEMIKVACQCYIGQTLRIPGQPSFEGVFITEEYIKKFRKYWRRDIRRTIAVIEQEFVRDRPGYYEACQRAFRRMDTDGESIYTYQERKRRQPQSH